MIKIFVLQILLTHGVAAEMWRKKGPWWWQQLGNQEGTLTSAGTGPWSRPGHATSTSTGLLISYPLICWWVVVVVVVLGY